MQIKLSHGSGGVETNQLINDVFLKYLGAHIIGANEDAGIAKGASLFAMSTDSYIVQPIFFAGGDIGKLSICGSLNDVAMMGAKPKFISIGFMIEEGFKINQLEVILKSMEHELANSGVKILSADTKVLPKGQMEGIFINTTAYGEVIKEGLSAKNLQVGDAIIISGNIGTHGSVIFCARNEIDLKSDLKSDCAQLFPMLEEILYGKYKIHALRDATRGGLASVLNEWAKESSIGITLKEAQIPILDEVRGVCEILGLEPSVLANEGVCVIAAHKDDADAIIKILQKHKMGKNACIIGEVSETNTKRVIVKNAYNSSVLLEYPSGELLPRIC